MAGTYVIHTAPAMYGNEGATLYRVVSPRDSNSNLFYTPARPEDVLRGVGAELSEDRNGGVLALVHGAPSVPVAIALASHLARRFRVTAVYCKQGEREGYVVAASEHPSYPVGCFIPESEVST